VNNARPEATLFTNVFGAAFQIITHFLSPVENPNDVGPKPSRFGDVTWQSSLDSSECGHSCGNLTCVPTGRDQFDLNERGIVWISNVPAAPEQPSSSLLSMSAMVAVISAVGCSLRRLSPCTESIC
jgi:hypothetical protein